jgi:hypothetical protein
MFYLNAPIWNGYLLLMLLSIGTALDLLSTLKNHQLMALSVIWIFYSVVFLSWLAARLPYWLSESPDSCQTSEGLPIDIINRMKARPKAHRPDMRIEAVIVALAGGFLALINGLLQAPA